MEGVRFGYGALPACRGRGRATADFLQMADALPSVRLVMRCGLRGGRDGRSRKVNCPASLRDLCIEARH